VFVADSCGGTDLHHAAEHMGSNVGTARLIAKVFGEEFVVPVRCLEARLDGYLRNRKSPFNI
jgi:hypothetical protein